MTPESWAGWGPEAWLVLDGLAAYRLTRLAVKDSITTRPRRWLVDRFEGPFVELATCAWCLGFWVALAVVVAGTVFFPLAWSYAASVLAVAAFVGWLSDREA